MPDPACSSSKVSRICILDDHPLICEALTVAIDCHPDLRVCGCAGDAGGAIPLIRESKPDAILLDISLRGESGLEAWRMPDLE